MHTVSQNTLKILKTVFFIALAIWHLKSSCNAITPQACSNCHTMHASYFEGGTHKTITPNPALLKTTCIGCHSGSTGATSSPWGAPIVYHTSNPGGTGPGKTLAGGDFYWVTIGNYTNGHNVRELVNTGSVTPQGWDPAATSNLPYGRVANGSSTWNQQLSCAGTFGCHGNHNSNDPIVAIKGAHHNNTKVGNSATKADSTTINNYGIGGSYRFLAGIYGLEDPDWEYSASSSDHNEYYGVNGNINYANKNTISYLCAECHGYFHSGIDDATAGSPWLRHPVDILLPNSWEYSNYTTYNLVAPIARPQVRSTPTSTVSPGSTTDTGAIVMCLSCHRAHGSENNYILRWDYRGWPGNNQTIGCSVCHSTKY